MKNIIRFSEFLSEKKTKKADKVEDTKISDKKEKDTKISDKKEKDTKISNKKEKEQSVDIEVPKGIKGLSDSQKKNLSPGLQAAIIKRQIKNFKKGGKEKVNEEHLIGDGIVRKINIAIQKLDNLKNWILVPVAELIDEKDEMYVKTTVDEIFAELKSNIEKFI